MRAFALVAAAAVAQLSVVASPVNSAPVVARQDVDCSPNSRSGLKAECWDSLDMNTFIEEWMAANATEANCDELGFAQCFLQFNGFNSLTCNLITSSTCPPFQTNDPATYYSNQQFYALWNIYAVYQFFNQYSRALSNGISLAGQTVDSIVAAVAPPVEAQAGQDTLINVIGSTLGITSLFTGVIPGAAGTAVGLLHGGLTQAFQASQKLGQTLAPTQTAGDRFVQLADIGSSLARLVEQYQDNLLNTVIEVQGNHTVFLAACSDGGFSQRVTTSLTIQSSQMYRQLQLFILSSALKANGMVSSRSTGVNALEYAKEIDAISCEALTPEGSCNQWWVDAEAGNTYALHNPNDPTNNQVDLTASIVSNGWAALDEVFRVEDCQDQDAVFDPATLGVKCLATHKFCEWNYLDSPGQARFEAQFTNCDNDPNWGELCGSFQDGIVVPESYLGPLFRFSAATCKR